MLTPDQVDWFNKMEALFGTEGWKTFMDDVKSARDATKESALWQRSWDATMFERGRLNTFEWLLNYESTAATLKSQLEGEPDA